MKIAFATTLLALPAAFGFKQTSVYGRDLQESSDDVQVDEYEFLQHYEQVYVTCDPNKIMTNVNGGYEYGAVVYRLCPSGTACSKRGNVCNSGKGDYVIGLQTYMNRFMQQFQNEQQQSGTYNVDKNYGNFNLEDFGQCGALNVESADGSSVQYYVGPMCTTGGDIKLALFTYNEGDEYACVPENESKSTTFYELTGFDLPWSSSILDDEVCKAYYCYTYDENDAAQYNEFCEQMFQNAIMKCEEDMKYYSPYGQSISDCEAVSAMLPKSTSSAGRAGWIIAALLVAGAAGFGAFYFIQQKKKSSVNQEGLMM